MGGRGEGGGERVGGGVRGRGKWETFDSDTGTNSR